MSAVLVYITAKDADEAERVGRALVESRLAACVNIIDNMRSLYQWKGEIHSSSETVLLAKTRVGQVSSLVDTVRSVHSYECPCVVAVPIVDGNPAFIDWIRQETTQAGAHD